VNCKENGGIVTNADMIGVADNVKRVVRPHKWPNVGTKQSMQGARRLVIEALPVSGACKDKNPE
jgi:hypothetical protein